MQVAHKWPPTATDCCRRRRSWIAKVIIAEASFDIHRDILTDCRRTVRVLFRTASDRTSEAPPCAIDALTLQRSQQH